MGNAIRVRHLRSGLPRPLCKLQPSRQAWGAIAQVLYVRPEGKHRQSPPSHSTYVQSTARIGPNSARLLFTRTAHR